MARISQLPARLGPVSPAAYSRVRRSVFEVLGGRDPGEPHSVAAVTEVQVDDHGRPEPPLESHRLEAEGDVGGSG